MKLRSLLFVPADSERKFAKADGIGADALILDLEDSVAPGRKALARDAVKTLLGGGPRNWSFLVRINPFGTGLTLEDLAAVVRPGLDGLLLPKVNGIEDVDLISHYVDVLEVAAGVPAGHVKLLTVATETPAAMIGFSGYARKNKRLVGVTWGGEDLSAALGALTPREADGSWTFPYQVARAQCLFAAAVPLWMGDLPVSGGGREWRVGRAPSRRGRARNPLCRFQGSAGARRELQDRPARRLRRPHRDPSGSGRDHQHLLHAV